MKYLKVFTDFAEAMSTIGDAEKGRLFMAMLKYAETSELPDLRGNERFVWPTAKLHIDRAMKENMRLTENGKMGGRPKATITNDNQRKPTESQKDKYKDKDNNTPPYIPPVNTFARFDEFWREYPRKINKANAQKAWGKLKPDDALVDKMMKAVAEQKKSVLWTKDGEQFIPHAATWLNGQRWEDEVGKPPPKRTSAHNHLTRNYTDAEINAIGRDLLEDA